MLAPKLADYSGMRENSEVPGCRYGLLLEMPLSPIPPSADQAGDDDAGAAYGA